jgi:hypothetical protein
MPQKILTPFDQIQGITTYSAEVPADGSLGIIIAPRGRRWSLAVHNNAAGAEELDIFATLDGDDQIKDGNALWNRVTTVPPAGAGATPPNFYAEGFTATAIAFSAPIVGDLTPYRVGITVHP